MLVLRWIEESRRLRGTVEEIGTKEKIKGVELPYKAVHCSCCTVLRAATGSKASEGKTMADPWVAVGESVDSTKEYEGKIEGL